jgi:hypothetical protein
MAIAARSPPPHHRPTSSFHLAASWSPGRPPAFGLGSALGLIRTESRERARGRTLEQEAASALWLLPPPPRTSRQEERRGDGRGRRKGEEMGEGRGVARVWIGTQEARCGGLGFDRLDLFCVFSEKRGALDGVARWLRWFDRLIRGRHILVNWLAGDRVASKMSFLNHLSNMWCKNDPILCICVYLGMEKKVALGSFNFLCLKNSFFIFLMLKMGFFEKHLPKICSKNRPPQF